MICRSEREAVWQRRCVKLSCELSSVGSADPRRVFGCAASLRCPPLVSAPGYWSGVPLSAVCFEMISWTGFRPIDAVPIGPGHVDRDGVLVLRQSKVKAPAFMPRSAALPPYAHPCARERDLLLDAVAATNLRQATFLATEAGTPRPEKGLGNQMRECARAAGVETSAHSLRKSRGFALAEGGASAHQIMSWGGWQPLKEAEHTAAWQTADVLGDGRRGHDRGTAVHFEPLRQAGNTDHEGCPLIRIRLRPQI